MYICILHVVQLCTTIFELHSTVLKQLDKPSYKISAAGRPSQALQKAAGAGAEKMLHNHGINHQEVGM